MKYLVDIHTMNVELWTKLTYALFILLLIGFLPVLPIIFLWFICSEIVKISISETESRGYGWNFIKNSLSIKSISLLNLYILNTYVDLTKFLGDICASSDLDWLKNSRVSPLRSVPIIPFLDEATKIIIWHFFALILNDLFCLLLFLLLQFALVYPEI